ncbi:hypothetical protein PFC_00550 [Pyrococcus furiosus COM1]|uniref:Uncharacterized protein n=1 Tax=Pyrococcus furiosus COM1 TaxID=1185654 RepID=I6TUW8_9EURY|nr:hypothetical protein PFC_00550 [Pyrococcus furiosus COM1]
MVCFVYKWGVVGEGGCPVRLINSSDVITPMGNWGKKAPCSNKTTKELKGMLLNAKGSPLLVFQ